jgi:hypothetical protein
VRATDPHISIAGDITADELCRLLGRLELVNGFANRFLFVLTMRSKRLPEGGRLTEAELNELTTELSKALEAARKIGRVERDPEAAKLWAAMYSELSADRPGLLGAATSRAAAQGLRLSLIYALLDGSSLVRPVHLRAAREVWRYCEDSACFLLGDAVDAFVDRLLTAIREAGKSGLSGTQIRDLFGRHARMNDRNRALAQLQAAGLVVKVRVNTGAGRSSCGSRPRGGFRRTYQHLEATRIGFVALVASVAAYRSSPRFLRHGDESHQSDGSQAPSRDLLRRNARRRSRLGSVLEARVRSN